MAIMTMTFAGLSACRRSRRHIIPPMWMRRVTASVLLLGCIYSWGQRSSGPAKGTLIVDGGGTTDSVKDRFVSIAGGKEARIVAIPTGASSIRFGPQKIILNPDWPRNRPEWLAYEA